ncbi:DUF5658 family protein [Sphingomonas sp. SRS2]|uniref:DUF5658 family protein n=1 Tax=Sphingomonas sp. SRS2 TaxID=133190 RepID=UPI00061846DE|nr:DUF5658 family protein [Sphingomonas sp. SRS2]KKC27431.1 hypothetical protein WP12_03385 [Sphingomonas sp. SRS2]
MKAVLAAIALALAAASPAHGRSLGDRIAEMPDEAWGTSALFFADAGSTYSVVRQGGQEANPVARAIVGRRPSAGKLAAYAAGKSLLYLTGISLLQDRDPAGARRAAQITMGVQAGVVIWNLTIAL